MKANSNQAVIGRLAGLGAGADVVSEGELKRALRRRHSRPSRSCSPASARPSARSRSRSTRASSASTSKSEPELALLSAIAAAKGPQRADLDPRQSRRRRQDPSQDRHRQGGEQVRHPDQPRARGLCPCRQAARHRGDRRRHAYRQPDHRPRPFGDAFALLAELVGTLRADGHTIAQSISAAASASPIATTTSRRRIAGSLCRGGQAARRAISAAG